MPTIPSWYEGDWDVTRLGGVELPGQVDVNVKIKANIDRQKGTGKRKARSRDLGDSQVQVTITITMTPDELERFAEIVPYLDPGRRRGVRDPLDIEHPNTALWGVEAITILELDSPQPEPGGFWVVTISAEEWTADVAADKPVKKGKQKPKAEGDAAAGKRNWADEFLEPKDPIGPPDPIREYRPAAGPPSDSAEDMVFGPPPPPNPWFG